MSARLHGPTRAGAWRGGCHSESSAIAAVTDPAMLVQAWCVAVPIGKRISIVAQLIVSTSVWSLASAHYTVVASVTRIGPRTSTAVLLGAHTCTGSDCGPAPWSPSTRQNRAGPARANSLQPRWHRMPSTADIRPIVAPPSCFRRKAASVGTSRHHQPPFGHPILPWLSVRPASLEYRK